METDELGDATIATTQAADDLICAFLTYTDDLFDCCENELIDAHHQALARQMLDDMAVIVRKTYDTDGYLEEVIAEIRTGNPSLTIVGHIAGCGVCMITAEVIATWDDGRATYWLRGYDELMFQMERWWDRLAED